MYWIHLQNRQHLEISQPVLDWPMGYENRSVTLTFLGEMVDMAKSVE